MWRWRQEISVCASQSFEESEGEVAAEEARGQETLMTLSQVGFSWAEHGMENHTYATCSGKL